MLTLTFLPNPFNASVRIVKTVEFEQGMTPREYLSLLFGIEESHELAVSINGGLLTEESINDPYYVNDGDYLAACVTVGSDDKAKNPLAIIASLALFAFSGPLFDALGIAGKSPMAMLAQGAVMMVGGFLINHLFPAPQQDLANIDTNSSTTYGWGKMSPLTGQGNALATTYGTVKTAGSLIAQHIKTNADNSQTLQLLFCGGEGPIDDLSSIMINDNPIENMPTITSHIRLGENDQAPISAFSKVYADQYLSYELSPEWTTHSTEGDGGFGIEITCECPNGIYTVNSVGEFEEAHVTLDLQVRRNKGEWYRLDESVAPLSLSRQRLGRDGVWEVYKVPYEVVTGFTALPGAIEEIWTVEMLIGETTVIYPPLEPGSTPESPIYNSPPSYQFVFSVTGSISGRTANAISTVPYNNGKVKFVINDLSVHYKEGDIVMRTGMVVRDVIHVGYVVYTFRGHSTDPLRKSGYWQLAQGQYDVRIRIREKSSYEEGRGMTKVNWTILSHVTEDNLSRPGRVLLGLEIPASASLSSTPRVTWQQSRYHIWYWDGGLGRYVKTAARNPAAACYDMLHRARQLRDIHTKEMKIVSRGVPKERIDFKAFQKWWEFCESRHLYFSMFFDTSQEFGEAIANPEGVGRGKVLLKGTTYSCVFDGPRDVTQMFTVSNIIDGTFKQEFLGKDGRANAIEISFTNKDKDYEKDTVVVFGDEWNASTDLSNPTQISMPGIDNFAQAFVEASYRLHLVNTLHRTLSIGAAVDSIACTIGDVIAVSTDVTKWGVSGRLMNEIHADLFVLSTDVTIEGGKLYKISVRLSNDTIIDYTVVNTVAIGSSITTKSILVTDFSVLPQMYDAFVFGEINKSYKKFSVLGITRGKELTRTISGLEYYDEMYSLVYSYPTLYNGTLTLMDVTTAYSATPAPYTPTPTSAIALSVAGSVVPVKTTASSSAIRRPSKIVNVKVFTNEDDQLLIKHDASSDIDFEDYSYYVEIVE